MARFSRNGMISLLGEAPRYDLGESYGPDLSIGELLDGDLSDLAATSLGYGTPQGNLRLRQAIAQAHRVDAEDVVVTIGGVHALFLLAFILCDRGDEAVIASPVFPPARAVLDAVGASVRVLPLTFERRYQPDLELLRGLLSARTRLVSLASPQNPSGVAIPLTTLAAVRALMDEVCPRAILLVDETYREAAYGTDSTAASAVGLGPRAVSVASLSKCHGAAGLRLGWAITRDPDLREELVLAKFNTVISCSPVDEMLALRVMERQDDIVGARRRPFAETLAATEEWVERHRDLVDWVRPDAGALCCIRLKPSVFDETSVARFHEELSRRGVRVAQGAWLGDEARVIRVGFGLLPLADLKEALRAVAEALAQATRAAA